MVRVQPIQPSLTTALLGAGASVESGVPTAVPLMESLIAALVHVTWARSALVEAINGRATASPYDYLRFEQLLEWVSEVFDSDLDFLSFLDDFVEPSRIHRAMARAALDGTTLLTVNFDDLLERAVVDEGATAVTLDAHRRFPVPQPPNIGVVKLHGSQKWHAPTGSPRRPQATVDRIAAANPGMVLNREASVFLKSVIDRRTLIVCGYSASDDLDVVPALHSCRPDRVVWFDWKPGKPRRLSDRDWTAETSNWAALARAWADAGTMIDVLRGDTAEALGLIGLTVPSFEPIDPPDWRRSLRLWADRVRWKDPTGLGLAGLVLGDLEMGDLSVRALSESRSTTASGATWTSHRRLYELAQGLLLKTPSEPQRAHGYALRSLKAARESQNPTNEAYAHLLLGRVESLRERGEESQALDHFARAMEKTDPTSLEWAFAAERCANVLARSGKAAESIGLAKAAVKTFRREGLVSSEIDGLMVLAVAKSDDGSWQAVDRYLDRAHAMATKLGYPERAFEILEIRAASRFHRGELVQAEAVARSALALMGSAPHDEASLAYRTLGRIARERGQYRASVDLFDAAIKRCSSVTQDVLPSLMADRGESLLLAGTPRPIMTIVREAEAMGSTDWATNAYLSALRQRTSLSAVDTADLSTMLRSRPKAVARDVAVQLGMSLARLDINVRGTKLTLYRAEQAARQLGASSRVSLLEATRRSI